MWKDLTMQQRADLMDIYLSHGISSLDEMKNHYDSRNQFASGGNLFSGEDTPTQQMNNGLNLYRRTNNLGETEYIYQETPDSEEILLTPTNKRFSDDPTNWDYKDANGREYSPRMIKPTNSSTLEASEKMGPLEKYVAELNWRAKNDPASIALQGKYTMPAIAAAPFLAWAGEAAYPYVSTALANPYVDAGITSAFASHGLNHAINEGINGWGDAAMTALELAPLGRLAKPIYNVGKSKVAEFLPSDAQKARFFETAMRSGSSNSPMQDVAQGLLTMLINKDGGYSRLYNIGKYIATGATSNKPKGFYNSFARLKDADGFSGYYGGFDNPISGEMAGKNDIIDAFLYGKEIDPAFGLKKVSQGNDFGPHAKYISQNYPDKIDEIPVYEITDPFYTPTFGYTPKDITVHGSEYSAPFAQRNGWTPDVAGHLQQVADNETMIMGQDIWKFNPADYSKKWGISNPILKYGLKELNRIGTPVVTRTPWFNIGNNDMGLSTIKEAWKQSLGN